MVMGSNEGFKIKDESVCGGSEEVDERTIVE
jgi:hypothetical protein